MAKVHFFYSAMNAGKTTHLLQANYNYKNDGFNTFLIKPRVDDRFGVDKITSRLGCDADALPIGNDESIAKIILEKHEKKKIDFIMADEVQFFSEKQILELSYLADQHDITVMAYGLRSDFRGKLFEGSKALFEVSNNLTEIKKICHCGAKATMVLRYDQYGEVARDGNVVEIGAEDRYVSVCRKDFFEGNIGNQAREALQENREKLSNSQYDKLTKERYANILAKTMKWKFETAMEFAVEDISLLIKKIDDEIEAINSTENQLNNVDFTLIIYKEQVLAGLLSSKKELYKFL